MLRLVTTLNEVRTASEPYVGSYLGKWRIQTPATFTGREPRGKLSQTTFVGSLSEVASEIIRESANRSGLVCTNKNGPGADIISALSEIGVHYDHATQRLSGEPVPDAPRELTVAEKYAEAQNAKASALAAQQAADAALAALHSDMVAESDAELAELAAKIEAAKARRAVIVPSPVSGVTSISAPVETVETVQTVETEDKPQRSVRK